MKLTKISSAKATPSPFAVTAAPGAGAELSEGSRKGFFDMAVVVGNGNCWTVGSGLRGEGEAALMRLRNGLLELMLRLPGASLGERWASVQAARVSGRCLAGCRDRSEIGKRLKQEGGLACSRWDAGLPCATMAIFSCRFGPFRVPMLCAGGGGCGGRVNGKGEKLAHT